MNATATAPTSAAPALPQGASTARMREAARRFEAQALGALLQPVLGPAPKGLLSGGSAEAQWRPMLIDNYARGWAARGGVGIADAVLAEMVRTQAAVRGARGSEEPT